MKDQTILIDLGIQVSSYRIAKGLSQAELAKQSERSIEYIDDIESGKIDCDIVDLYRIANVLDVRISELFKAPDNSK